MGTVARNIKVIFVDDRPDNDPLDTGGFSRTNRDLVFQWIIDNALQYNIRVISMSSSYTDNWANSAIIDPGGLNSQLIDMGILMVSSAGNRAVQYNSLYFNWFYPQMHKEWLAIGAIDHEDRSGNQGSEIGTPWEFPFPIVNCDDQPCGTSWGATTEVEHNLNGNGVDFAMPGNGVPVYLGGVWQYGLGTSFSTPFFAAAVAIANDAYYDGRKDHSGFASTNKDPSYSTVMDILMNSIDQSKTATSATWTKQLGWGVVDLDALYSYSRLLGYLSFIPLTIVTPTNNEVVWDTVAINGNADYYDYSQVNFYIDGVLIATDNSPPYLYYWDTTSYTNNVHQIKLEGIGVDGVINTQIINVMVLNTCQIYCFEM